MKSAALNPAHVVYAAICLAFSGCGGYTAGTNVPCFVAGNVIATKVPTHVVVRGPGNDYSVSIYRADDEGDTYQYCSANLPWLLVGEDYTLYVLDGAPQTDPTNPARLVWPGVTVLHVEEIDDYPGQDFYDLGYVD